MGKGVGNGKGNRMGNGMRNGMGNGIGNGKRNGMGNGIWNGMGNEMGNGTGNEMGSGIGSKLAGLRSSIHCEIQSFDKKPHSIGRPPNPALHFLQAQPVPCPEGKTISFQGKTQGTNVLLWPSVPDSELCVLIQSPGPHTSPPGNGRNNHSPSFGKEQLSSVQILPNYVKGLTDTWLQLLNESKQGKIKESWSVGQHQPENKPKESLRNTTALGDRPGHPGGGSLSVPKGTDYLQLQLEKLTQMSMNTGCVRDLPGAKSGCQHHGITNSSRLEKTFKVMETNCKPNTAKQRDEL
ncbi:hypothetical protein HGM15179_012494 [Zosterops borbonicus]|uniref:Uncharacterized protein n=1 Tax=Zosterops borbonicus TaxID=364589 RepID=A0A8K1LI19_9PASS|nr:hypothetical protein HGM15179_012494 [Zosterops borbonicus]